jgi:hypothetical protein
MSGASSDVKKLAEILSSYWGRFLDGKRLDQDADVACHLVRLVVALQGLWVRGEQLLVLAERLLDGDGSSETSAKFGGLLGEQVRAVDSLLAHSTYRGRERDAERSNGWHGCSFVGRWVDGKDAVAFVSHLRRPPVHGLLGAAVDNPARLMCETRPRPPVVGH